MQDLSPLQKKRLSYKPVYPQILQNINTLEPVFEKNPYLHPEVTSNDFSNSLNLPLVRFKEGVGKEAKPLRVAVLFSGGQAPGGHNVVSGLFDALKIFHPKTKLFGFLNGPKGLIENQHKEITFSLLKSYRNQGGFDLLGSGRTKIETLEQFAKSKETCLALRLDGLVIIGGDDSNTNAAFLAEYFKKENCKTVVVGIPKTIDGDLRFGPVEISFGFDTACKTYSEIISNIARDAISAKKYYHFIKLMGRSASHVALECALETHPNLTIIAEEVFKNNLSLSNIIDEIVSLIIERSKIEKNYGIILIPEGLIEFIPEVKELIQELNSFVSKIENLKTLDEKIEAAKKELTPESLQIFQSVPSSIQRQLLLDRDPHGNVQVSKIDTEKLILEMVQKKLKNNPSFEGKFSAQSHFVGYEGRAAFPSNFDATYCSTLGRLAALFVHFELSGYMASVSKLKENSLIWEVQALPIVSMLHAEMRKGQKRLVIAKALVDLQSKQFQVFAGQRDTWKLEDHYRYVGPIQFIPKTLADAPVLTLTL